MYPVHLFGGNHLHIIRNDQCESCDVRKHECLECISAIYLTIKCLESLVYGLHVVRFTIGFTNYRVYLLIIFLMTIEMEDNVIWHNLKVKLFIFKCT